MENQKKQKRFFRNWPRVIAGLFILLALGAARISRPWNLDEIQSTQQATNTYQAAVQALKAFDGPDSSAMWSECRLQFFDHGQATEKVAVLVHGYTSCPQQFHRLGELFYQQGYNVLIAPLPRHGLKNRLNIEQGELQAEELAAYTDKVVDIGAGLGREITMMGLSAGGVITGWAAQNRPEIHRAIIISPAFGYTALPKVLEAPVMNLAGILPDAYSWWDEDRKEQLSPPHAYPRFSRRALSQILRLSFAVRKASEKNPPKAREIVLVTNANDALVDRDIMKRIMDNWRSKGARLKTYEFPAQLGLEHDLIEPELPEQQVNLVYPKLIELAE